jgi:hypothetical protein
MAGNAMDDEVELLGVLSRCLVTRFCLSSLLQGEFDPGNLAGLL